MQEARRHPEALVLAFLFCLSSGSPALAAERPSVHAALGVIWPSALPSGLWLAAGGSIPLWRVSIEPELGYWSRSETAFGLRASFRDLHAGLSVRAAFARIGPVRLFVGGGGAAHFLRVSGGPVAGQTASESVARPGLQAFGGLEAGLGRVTLFAAGRSDWILRSDTQNERETRLYGGVRLPF